MIVNNCIDFPCKHRCDTFHTSYCSLHNSEVPDDVDVTGCKDFVFAHTCIDCKHTKSTTYETGTIDDIEYKCPFQDNKLIYDDLNPYLSHYSDIPECNCNKFELNGGEYYNE